MRQNGLRLTAFLGFSAILAIIGFAYRQALQDFLIDPVLQLYWRIRQVWMGFDPEMVWGFFLLMVILLVVLAFPSIQKALESPVFKQMQSGRRRIGSVTDELPGGMEGRLEFWLNEVHQIHVERYLARLVVVELKKLILDQLAFRERFPTRQQAERWLKENGSKFPEGVRVLFFPKPPVEPGSLDKRLGWLRRWFSFQTENTRPTTASNLDEIIHYLEHKPGEKP
jgi:hypothetical protein